MAQINLSNIKKIEKQCNDIRDKLYIMDTSFEMEESKYIKIDIFGGIVLENQRKLSRFIQLNRKIIKCLLKLLMQEISLV